MGTPTFSLNADHRGPLKAHFDALGDEDAQLRFGSRVPIEVRRRYVDGIDFTRDAVFGVFADDLALRGVAHLACGESEAELGLSVLDSSRGQGIGSALFERAIIHARNQGISVLTMNCLAQNAAIMHIARKAGMRIVIAQAGADAYLELPPGNPLTLGQELAEQEIARFDWTLKANLNYVRALLPA